MDPITGALWAQGLKTLMPYVAQAGANILGPSAADRQQQSFEQQRAQGQLTRDQLAELAQQNYDLQRQYPNQVYQAPTRGYMGEAGTLASLLGGLNQMVRPGASFAPIERAAREKFQQEMIPALMERFGAEGPSSALTQNLGTELQNLETQLAGQRSKHELAQYLARERNLPALMQLGTQPTFENIIAGKDALEVPESGFDFLKRQGGNVAERVRGAYEDRFGGPQQRPGGGPPLSALHRNPQGATQRTQRQAQEAVNRLNVRGAGQLNRMAQRRLPSDPHLQSIINNSNRSQAKNIVSLMNRPDADRIPMFKQMRTPREAVQLDRMLNDKNQRIQQLARHINSRNDFNKLMAAFASGNRRAITELYRKWRPWIMRGGNK